MLENIIWSGKNFGTIPLVLYFRFTDWIQPHVCIDHCNKNDIIFLKDNYIQPRSSLVNATTWLNLIGEPKTPKKLYLSFTPMRYGILILLWTWKIYNPVHNYMLGLNYYCWCRTNGGIHVINWVQVLHSSLASHLSKILAFSQISISHQTISTLHHPRWIKLWEYGRYQKDFAFE